MLTCAGLYYDGIGNDIGTEMALLEANRLNVALTVAEAKERAAQAKLEQQLLLQQQQQEQASVHVADADGNTSDQKENLQPSPIGDDGGKLLPLPVTSCAVPLTRSVVGISLLTTRCLH